MYTKRHLFVYYSSSAEEVGSEPNRRQPRPDGPLKLYSKEPGTSGLANPSALLLRSRGPVIGHRALTPRR